MTTPRRLVRSRSIVRVLHQGWIEKRAKRQVFGWRERWLVLRTDGELMVFEERPTSLLDKKKPTAIYKIEPWSTISRVKAGVRLTWGDKSIGNFQERVIRHSSLRDKEKNQEIVKKIAKFETDKWFKLLKEIALRKRLKHVIDFREQKIEEKSSEEILVVEINSMNKSKGKLDIEHERRVSEKLDANFYSDKILLWKNAVRYNRTSEGDQVYFEFASYNLKIVWKMYAESLGKTYISKTALKDLLWDALNTNGNNSREEVNKLRLSLDEKAFLAKVYLDKDMDGKVVYEEFEKVNTKDFWLTIDFLSPIDQWAETQKFWISIFNCLEEFGSLSSHLIYLAFEKYDSKDEGFLYQEDIENFLKDFMRVTPLKWPTVDQNQVDEFCKSIVLRAAIALRYLDKDESGRVSREEFKAIGSADFWSHVDFITTLDAYEPSRISDDGFNISLDDILDDEKNTARRVTTSRNTLSSMIEENYSSYLEYSRLVRYNSDSFVARPSFCKSKFIRRGTIDSPLSVKNCGSGLLFPIKSELSIGSQSRKLNDLCSKSISASTSGFPEINIDPRLLSLHAPDCHVETQATESQELD